MIARPDFPAKNVAEVIAYVKDNPGKVNYASVGAGGVVHLAMSWFNTLYGLKMEHVPYKGLVQALQDMTTSRVDMMLAVSGGAMPFVTAGKLRAYAVSGPRRIPIAQNVVTFTEAGFPAYEASFYFAMAAPAGLDPALADRLAADFGKIIQSAEFGQKYLHNLGFEPIAETPAQFAAFLQGDRESAAKRVKAAGVTLD
jgi:tripartite-type tricarboxylate transporter receptor subunit TctC